jgi:hypothetical protein
MADQNSTTVLMPDAAARLAEFARACRAAARAVSLYPGGHPAIGSCLDRLVQMTASVTASGPYRVQVLADALLVAGAGPARPDAGISELAQLLHRHLIGALTINAGADAESWRALLLLLARPSEEVRADGGIRHLWTKGGGPSLEIEEIDYAEVLREKQGVEAAVAQILSAALEGRGLELDDSGMRLLLEIVQDPARLDELMAQLDTASGEHGGAELYAAAFLNLARSLTEWLAARDPQGVDSLLRRMGRAAGRLPADAMLELLRHRHGGEGAAGTINVAAGIVERMGDETVAHFVASSVMMERGATERLAHAFQALVPDTDRQRQLLALAGQEVSASEGRPEGFAELWARVEGILSSYSDDSFVSEQYGRELSSARTRAVDVEAASDDPPERIGTWLATVGDAALRSLDHHLLLDLLRIEEDAPRWRDLAETVSAHAEDLVRVGRVDQAWQLADAVVAEGQRDAGRHGYASAALQRFARSGMMKHLSSHLRAADDASYGRFTALCHAIGPPVIPALAEVLSAETDARSRRRLRDILIGFGPSGREAVQQLMNATNWEVRRTAAYLLREFGGAEGLKELIPLLTDTEPLVQREAVQGLVLNGSDEASKTLLQAVTSASGRTRETLLKELTAMRDERAAPLFCYLVRHMDRRREEQLYLYAIDALGTFGGPDAVGALKFAIYQGDWWSPVTTGRLRAAAVRALGRIGTPAAIDALQEASARGSRGVRSVARSELTRLG